MEMSKKIGLVVLILLVGSIHTVTAGRWEQVPEFAFKNVTSIQYDTITHIIWFGTSNDGVWRFDGQQFKHLTPITGTGRIVNQVTVLALDGRKQELWVGSPEGLFRYCIKTNKWEHYTPDSGLSQICVPAVFVDDQGTLWYGSESEDGETGGGVGKRDSTGWYRYTTEEYARWDPTVRDWIPDSTGQPIAGTQPQRNLIESIAQDDKGNMYFGTSGAGLCILDTTGMWDCSAPLTGGNTTVKAIAMDRRGNKWLGTIDGVCLLDRNNTLVSCFKRESVNPNSLVNSVVNTIWIETYRDGEIKWFGTDGGVSALDSTNQLWKNFNTVTSGLAANEILAIVGDSDGSIWFGLAELRGVSKLNNNWSELTRRERLSSNFTRAVEKDKYGRLWVGTDQSGGIDILDHGVWKGVLLSDVACEGVSVVTDFFPEGTRMWVATFGCGLFRVSESLQVTQRIRVNNPAQFPSNYVLALAARNDTTLWAGTTAGLVRISISEREGIVDTVFHSGNSPLPGNDIPALACDGQGRLWVGTNRGIRVFDGTTWSDPQLAGNIVINSIARDSTDAMWVGTNGGIARFDGTNWTYFSTVDDLPNDKISSIGVAPDGTIWCGTVNGAAAYDGNKWTAYTTNDGLSNNFIFQLAFDPDPTVVWFATYGGGISRYRKTNFSPETYLSSTFEIVTETSVPFHYSGYDFNTPTLDLRYQYALDNPLEWSSITPITFATLTVDTDGLHTFYVRAIDKDANVDGSPAKLRFYKVRPQHGGAVTIIDTTRAQKLDSLWIYVPPNALPLGSTIRATPVVIDTTGFASKKRRFTGIAFDVGPHDLALNQKKPLTLAIFYRPSVVKQNETSLAIYHRNSDWQRIGGSVDGKRHAITATVTQLDTIALCEDLAPDQVDPGSNLITGVAAQPRVLSPNGRGFLDRVTLSFDLGKPADVTAKVYNLSGRLVRALCENQSMNPGRNVIEWNGRDYNNTICSSGLYIVTIESAGSMATKQVVVMNE